MKLWHCKPAFHYLFHWHPYHVWTYSSTTCNWRDDAAVGKPMAYQPIFDGVYPTNRVPRFSICSKFWLLACILLFVAWPSEESLRAQQLIVEAGSSISSTRYEAPYQQSSRFFNVGASVAGGWHKCQVGIKYERSIIHPTFTLEVNQVPFGKDRFEDQFVGLLIRTKLARYPAARTGLVLKGGAGLHQTTLTFNDPSGTLSISHQYDPYLGVFAGGGLSFPIGRYLMLEAAYEYHYAHRPDIANFRQAHRASYQSFQLGISYNMVFGKTKQRYNDIIKFK